MVREVEPSMQITSAVWEIPIDGEAFHLIVDPPREVKHPRGIYRMLRIEIEPCAGLPDERRKRIEIYISPKGRSIQVFESIWYRLSSGILVEYAWRLKRTFSRWGRKPGS